MASRRQQQPERPAPRLYLVTPAPEQLALRPDEVATALEAGDIAGRECDGDIVGPQRKLFRRRRHQTEPRRRVFRLLLPTGCHLPVDAFSIRRKQGDPLT